MSTDDGEPEEVWTGPTSFVQEAACAPHVVVLKVRTVGASPEVPRNAVVVIAATRSAPAGVGLVGSETRREIWGGKLPPGAPRQRAREAALAHAKVVALGEREVFIDQHGSMRVVRAENGRVIVTDEPTPAHLPRFAAGGADRAELERRGLELVEAVATDAVDAHRVEVGKILERAVQKIDRRREAVRGDLGKIAQADGIAEEAQWLVGVAAQAPRGATKLVVTDWSTGEPVTRDFPLDPSKSAKDQVAAMFKKAKRLRLGAAIAEERLAQADVQRAGVETAHAVALAATTLASIDAALADAKRIAPRDVAAPGAPGSGGSVRSSSKSAKQTRTPYRTFVGTSGKKILVGKGAADNDTLTLHVARPHDLWLHAKDRTGAHVVVMLDRGQTCPAEDLVDAAHLAAHFSEAREEAVVDVQYTDRRYLRKPKGSAPGAVVVDWEKVLVLRMEPARTRSLLERETLA